MQFAALDTQAADLCITDKYCPLRLSSLHHERQYVHAIAERQTDFRQRTEALHINNRLADQRCKKRGLRAAIRIAFYSGMRMDEIRRAERIADTFVLADTKNGQPRIVPMHRKIRCCAHVALPDQSRISKHFRDARIKVGLDWLHFHDLRHSAASSMINDGVDLYTVGAVLGHKTSASTQRYAHLATSSLRLAIDRIGAKKNG